MNEKEALETKLYEETLAQHNDPLGQYVYAPCETFASSNWNQSNNASNEQVSDEILTVNFVFGIVLTGLIIVTGLIGNALSFFVLLKTMNKAVTATPIILCALAIVDILFLLSSFYLQFIGALSDGPLKPYQTYIVPLFNLVFGVGNACRMCRNWLVILVSLERVIAVKNPLKATIIFTKANATVGVFIIVSGSQLLCLPRFFEARINHCVLEDGTLSSGAVSSELRQHSVYRYVYTIGFYFLMVTAGPCVILLVLNTLLILQVRQSNAERAALSALVEETKSPVGLSSTNLCNRTSRCDSPAGHRTNNTVSEPPNPLTRRAAQYSTEITRICIAIVVVYLICEAPPLLYQMKLSVIGDDHNAEYLDVLKPIANFFATANSGLNFYVYVFLGSRFRRHLTACRCCKVNEKTVNTDMYRSHTMSNSAVQRVSTGNGKKRVPLGTIRPNCPPQCTLDNVLRKSYLSVASEESSLYFPSRQSSRRSGHTSYRTANVSAQRQASIRTNSSAT